MLTRLILLIALIAVGYDAYVWQGQTTRTVVDGAVQGVERLSRQIGGPSAPSTPT